MDERLFYHLQEVDDAAADWSPGWRALPQRVKLPRMHMAAHGEWERAWKRGLVSDIEMAYYTMLINRHPASWMGWLRGM